MGHLMFEAALAVIVIIEGIAIYQLLKMYESLDGCIKALDGDVDKLKCLKERVSTAEDWIELAVPWMKNTQHRISTLKTRVQKLGGGAFDSKDEEDTAEDENGPLDAKGEFAEALLTAEAVAEGLKNEE